MRRSSGWHRTRASFPLSLVCTESKQDFLLAHLSVFICVHAYHFHSKLKEEQCNFVLFLCTLGWVFSVTYWERFGFFHSWIHFWQWNTGQGNLTKNKNLHFLTQSGLFWNYCWSFKLSFNTEFKLLIICFRPLQETDLFHPSIQKISPIRKQLFCGQ